MIHQTLTCGESNGRLPSTGASVGGKDHPDALFSLSLCIYATESQREDGGANSQRLSGQSDALVSNSEEEENQKEEEEEEKQTTRQSKLHNEATVPIFVKCKPYKATKREATASL